MTPHKFRNLDGLRGLAALVVVFAHYVASFYPVITDMGYKFHSRFDGSIANSPLNLLIAGNAAVCLFFVLSGFVLSSKFFQTRSIAVVISSAVRRYFRLMFPALASLLIVYLLLKYGGFFNHAIDQTTGSGLLTIIWRWPMHLSDILNLGLFGIFTQSDPVGPNPPLWTLYYEFLGSFLLFMTLALFGSLRHRWLFYVGLCYYFQQSYFLGFILGIIICDLWYNQDRFKPVLRWLSWPFLPLGLFLLNWTTSTHQTTFYNQFSLQNFTPVSLSILAHTIGAALLIIAALSLASLKRLLEIRPVQFLGRLSFSLYLIHFIVIGSYASYLFGHLILSHSYNQSFILTLIPSLLLTFIAAWLFAKLIDEPSIRLAKIIGTKLGSDQPLGLRRLLGRDLRSFIPGRSPATDTSPVGSMLTNLPPTPVASAPAPPPPS